MIHGLWMGDWGFEISETVRATADGPPEVFSHVPGRSSSRRSGMRNRAGTIQRNRLWPNIKCA